MADGFHPNNSKVTQSALEDFIRAPISGNLQEVPGIGPATEVALKENGISTTFGLIGKYLSLKEEGVGPVEHSDRFYFWLKSVLPRNAKYRAGIVHSICEKMNITFVGIYDPSIYGDADGSDDV